MVVIKLKINIGEIKVKDKITIGDIVIGAQKIYPELEDLEATPSLEEQVFTPDSYGFSKVKVKKIEGEELSVTPTTEKQINEGVYTKVITEAIECEEIKITPSEEEQVKEGLFNKVTVEGVENSGGISDEAFEGETVKLTDTVENTCIWDFGLKGKTIQSNTTPSPENPSEIQNVEGNVEVTVTGKNLVKQMNWKQLPSITTGKTVTTVYGYGTDYIEVDNRQQYVWSYEGETGAKYVCYYDGNQTYLGCASDLVISNYINWKSVKYVRLRTDNPENVVSNFQLEVNSLPTKYEPYQEQVITFPLSSGQKLYEGSYLADDGIHHVKKQVILNGTESWTAYKGGSVTNYYIQSDFLTNVRNNENVLCNCFETITKASYTANKIYVFSSLNGGVSIFVDNTDSRFSSLANFKAWLAQQYSNGTPVTVEYELAQEQVIPYTSAQQDAWNKLLL